MKVHFPRHALRCGSPARRSGRERGAILTVCLVLTAIGTFGMMAAVTLITNRAVDVEQGEAALRRRICRENSRILAREIIARKYVDSISGPAKSETHTLPDGWGACTLGPSSGTALTTTDGIRANRTGAVADFAYSLDLDVRLSGEDVDQPFQFQVKSYNPNLAGDLFVLGRPIADTGEKRKVTGDIRVKGRARLWTDGRSDKITLKADAYVGLGGDRPALALNDTADRPILPQNFPFVPMTGGRVGAAPVPGYDGRFGTAVNDAVKANTYANRIEASTEGATLLDGTVPLTFPELPTLPLDPTAPPVAPVLPPCLLSDGSGNVEVTLAGDFAGHLRVTKARNLTLIGQPDLAGLDLADALPPLIVLIDNPADGSIQLENIECRGSNRRRLILVVRQAAITKPVSLSFSAAAGFPTWRMLTHLENTPVTIDLKNAAASATLVGGVWTDRSFQLDKGTLFLEHENDPGELEWLATRVAWVETYRY